MVRQAEVGAREAAEKRNNNRMSRRGRILKSRTGGKERARSHVGNSTEKESHCKVEKWDDDFHCAKERTRNTKGKFTFVRRANVTRRKQVKFRGDIDHTTSY